MHEWQDILYSLFFNRFKNIALESQVRFYEWSSHGQLIARDAITEPRIFETQKSLCLLF